MSNLSDVDLGSTILSIAVAAGFVACGLAIVRLITTGIKSLIIRNNKNIKIDLKGNQNQKGFD